MVEEQERFNNVAMIIQTLGLSALTDSEDMWLRDYLEGKDGYCVQVVNDLVIQAHKIKNADSENQIL
jgi:hypothetical protein